MYTVSGTPEVRTHMYIESDVHNVVLIWGGGGLKSKTTYHYYCKFWSLSNWSNMSISDFHSRVFFVLFC